MSKKLFMISAHLEEKSFTCAMAETIKESFLQQGFQVLHSDLYAMGFNPVASKEDFHNPANPDYCNYALEQRHNYQNGGLSPDIKSEIEKLWQADSVLFVFPLYWFSVPAIIKGWIDRVLLSGLCYGGKRFYDQGPLKGKKASLVFSCGARESMFGKEALHGDYYEMLKPLLRGTLYYTGMEVLPPFVAHHIPYITAEKRVAILGQLKQYCGNWETMSPLAFSKISDFKNEF